MQLFNFPTAKLLYLLLLFTTFFSSFEQERAWFARNNKWVSLLLVSAEIDPQEVSNPPTPGGQIKVTSPDKGLYQIGQTVEVNWETSYETSSPNVRWLLVRVYEKSDKGRDHIVDQLPYEYRYTSLSANVTMHDYYKPDHQYYVKLFFSHEVYGTSPLFNVTNSTSPSPPQSTTTPFSSDRRRVRIR